jgi:ribonuclease R
MKVEGRIRVLSRGFGFVEHENGSLFAPPAMVRGLIDYDLVQAESIDGDVVSKITLIERGRERIVGDVREGRLVVDAAIANRVELPLHGATKNQNGHAIWWDLKNNREIMDLGRDPLERGALEVRIMERHMLPMGHVEAAEAEAEKIASEPRKSGNLRRDLRDTCVITIDADESRDLDDALCAQMLEDGSVRVWVHIADVAEYVKPGSAIDTEARECPTSVYLPQNVRHMLPELLAAEKLSLIPDEDRDALCIEMSIDVEGRVRSVDVYESLIRSRGRVSYIGVGEIVADGAEHQDNEIHATIGLLHVAASRLSVERAGRGGVDAWRTDEGSEAKAGEDWAHNIIERLMVAANEGIAKWLEDRSMGVMYRAHRGLSKEEALELDELCHEIGVMANSGGAHTPKSFAALAHAAHKAQKDLQFWDAAMSVMPRAQYQVEKMGHFGLGSDSYCHFTSPLRRYADLLIHREVKAYLHGEREENRDAMNEIAGHVNDTNRRADGAERDGIRAIEIAKLRRGQTGRAMIIGRQKKNWKVKMEGVGVWGVMPVREGDERYIGETINVEVRVLDPLVGTLEYALKKS